MSLFYMYEIIVNEILLGDASQDIIGEPASIMPPDDQIVDTNVTLDWPRRFALWSIGTMVVVVIAGCTSYLREIMYGAFASVMLVAFLPLVVIAAGFGIALVLTIASIGISLFGGVAGFVLGSAAGVGGEAVGTDVVFYGLTSAPRYYLWLARRRHPMFWGIIAGSVVGCGLLWLFIAIFVIPKESKTATIFAVSEQALNMYFYDSGLFPQPDSENHLLISDLPINIAYQENSRVLQDGFGRPVNYFVEPADNQSSFEFNLGSLSYKTKKAVCFRLSSSGYDSISTVDDLELIGPPMRAQKKTKESFRNSAKTKVGNFVKGVVLNKAKKTLSKLLKRIGNSDESEVQKVTWKDRLQAVQLLRRGNSPQIE